MKTNQKSRAVYQSAFKKFKRARWRIALLGMAMAGTSLVSSAGTCTINLDDNFQTIDGFGFSTAWSGQLTSAQGSILFGTASGDLGFSLLRVRIDPTENWSEETANASLAHSYGAKVLGTPWTPPAYMKSNDNTVAGTLNTSEYASYASYLNSAATSMGLDYVSMQNEPDANVDYESCSWTGSTMETWCANNASAVGKPVVMPESEGFNYSYSDPTLDNSTADSHVTIIAGHLYGVSPSTYSNALSHGKHVWMTEHYYDGANISTALTVAKEMSDCMNDQMSAYFWWWVDPGDAASFINGTTVDVRGYAMGQFAQWVRPGKICCSATYNPSSNVYVTAYHGSGVVVVAINMGTSAVSQTFSFQNASGITSLNVNQTSGSENMASLSAVSVSNNTFTYSLPAQSITTFHQF
jgi:glucuronoarabinoxylan endo-1,4-beta-xylanase